MPPETLPANFQGWDNPAAASAPPATLPANFSGWDQPDAAKPKSWALDPTQMGSPAHIADEVAGMIGDAAKNVARVSGPNVVYEVLRKNFPKLGLKPILGMPTQNEVMTTGLQVLAGGLEGEAEPGAAAPAKAATPKPGTAPNPATLLEHPAVTPWLGALKRELLKIPGADFAKTAYESAKGLAEGAPEPPAPPAPPVPTTNGVPWGTKIPPQGPPELWGKAIPHEQAPTTAAAATAPTAPAAAEPRTIVTDPQTGRPEFSDVVASKRETSAALGQALNEALGGRPLQKGVPLRMQGKATAAAASLPEGFTPVDSTALKGYKYDPASREFESITTGGQHYVHGDVSPEEAEAFEAADSKGRAWQQIRNNPLVAKVVNGKRVPVTGGTIQNEAGQVIPKAAAGAQSAVMQKAENLQQFITPSKAKPRTIVRDPETGQPEFSDVVAAKQKAAATGEEDLTDEWQKALDAIKAKKK